MEHIIEEATKIHGEYGSDDMDYVARKLGVEIHERLDAQNLKEVYFPDLKAMVLRPGLPRHERNYLISHGLGHHLFHGGISADGDSLVRRELTCGELEMGRMPASPIEREADLFAAYLLIPEIRLRPVLKQAWVRETNDPVLKLALEFQVPLELMVMRLVCEAVRH